MGEFLSGGAGFVKGFVSKFVGGDDTDFETIFAKNQRRNQQINKEKARLKDQGNLNDMALGIVRIMRSSVPGKEQDGRLELLGAGVKMAEYGAYLAKLSPKELEFHLTEQARSFKKAGFGALEVNLAAKQGAEGLADLARRARLIGVEKDKKELAEQKTSAGLEQADRPSRPSIRERNVFPTGGLVPLSAEGQIAQIETQIARLEDFEKGTDPEQPGGKRIAERIKRAREDKKRLEDRFLPSPARIAESAARGREVVSLKEGFRTGKRVPATFSAITGLGKMTVGEAESQGFQVPENQVMRDLQVQKGLRDRALRMFGQVRDIVRKNPESFGSSGRFGAIISGMEAQARNFLRLSGIPVEASLKLKTYRNVFNELSIDNQKLQSNLIGLAFISAATLGQKGRAVSDRDVALQMRRLGANIQDPNAFFEAIKVVEDEIDFAFRNRVQGATGVLPPSGIAERSNKVVGARSALSQKIAAGEIGSEVEAVPFLQSLGLSRAEAEAIVLEMRNAPR